MSDYIKYLEEIVTTASASPTLEQMPKRSLLDKGINGPTGAHVIESIHTPLNVAYVTFTTGSSAFQTPVIVAYEEIEGRIDVMKKIADTLDITADSKLLITYPPLVNVFSKQAFDAQNIKWGFLEHSSRDDLLLALLKHEYDVIVGESSFIRHTIQTAIKLDLIAELPKKLTIIAVGTPLDFELLDVVKPFGYSVNDLYGCQEFGWLFLNGKPLRDDISLIPSPTSISDKSSDLVEVLVGGLPMGDSFPYLLGSDKGHVCDSEGKLITYKRERSYPEYEVWIKSSTRSSKDLIERTARTILRIKSRVVRLCDDFKEKSNKTILQYLRPGSKEICYELDDISKIKLFESLVEAQRQLQNNAKTDPTWIKKR